MSPDRAAEYDLEAVWQVLAAEEAIRALALLARAEDLGEHGDITTICAIDPARRAAARLIAREPGVIAGLHTAPVLIDIFESDLTWTAHVEEGDQVASSAFSAPGATLATLTGRAADILTLERALLNTLSRLSGIATLTRAFVERVAGTSAVVCDTRKTTPGWRGLEKYAVACGGGTLHRIGLNDAVLIKDNHIAAVRLHELAAFVQRTAAAARERFQPDFIAVEVETIEQFEQLLTLDPGAIDIVLLDNMESHALRAAVALRDERNPTLSLEASGGVTLDTVRAIAETGVDRIAVGALTHSANWLDIALDIAIETETGPA